MTVSAGKDRITMARFITTAALLTAGLMLSGCAHDLLGSDDPAYDSNNTVYSENQPVVEYTDFALDLSTNGDSVPGNELARLDGWFAGLQLRYGDTISVADSFHSAGVRADVSRVAADYGILVSDDVPPTAGEVQPGSARVIVSRATASVPNCPNWRQSKLSGAPISTESNFGCAINSNLAAMIANPNDLVIGREGSGTRDAATASKAIKTYRDSEPSGKGGIQAVSTTGGN
jgi:pilus assembly protein CpaD